jgi:hypothetical protein
MKIAKFPIDFIKCAVIVSCEGAGNPNVRVATLRGLLNVKIARSVPTNKRI